MARLTIDIPDPLYRAFCDTVTEHTTHLPLERLRTLTLLAMRADILHALGAEPITTALREYMGWPGAETHPRGERLA